jgi:hypothetical protein
MDSAIKSNVAISDWDTSSWSVPVPNQMKTSKKLWVGLAAAGVFAGTILWQRQNRLKRLNHKEPKT